MSMAIRVAVLLPGIRLGRLSRKRSKKGYQKAAETRQRCQVTSLPVNLREKRGIGRERGRRRRKGEREWPILKKEKKGPVQTSR